MESVIINLVGLLISVIVLAIKGTREINKAELSIRSDIQRHRTETDAEIAKLKDTVRQNELWNRDNFARRDSFHATVSKLEDNLKLMEDKFAVQFDKIDGKLDKIRSSQ